MAAYLGIRIRKARVIQSQETGLRYREVEQAVMSVFLSSQPKHTEAQTHDLHVLVGATNPIALNWRRRCSDGQNCHGSWTKIEVSSGSTNPDGSRQLPTSWRLGNRPNLRQMHADACANKVQSAQVERLLEQRIRQFRSLTQGASATGARVHTLPDRPSDIPDDGEFHYAVLKPSAASESGKPSPEAKRFINETTGPDRPRANRNAVVLAVPSRDGLDLAENRIREYLGWARLKPSSSARVKPAPSTRMKPAPKVVQVRAALADSKCSTGSWQRQREISPTPSGKLTPSWSL